MGLNRGSNAVYLSIFNGRITQRVKTKTSTSVTRTNKDGKQVEEEIYKNIEGMLVGLDTKAHEEYGESLLIYIKDDKLYCLQVSMNSRYATNFLKALRNVDLEKPLQITPSEKVVDGKKESTIFLNQGGTAIKWYYTKDNRNGLPEPVEIKGNKKRGIPDKWDYSAVTDFLFNEVIEPFRDALKSKSAENNVPDSTEAPADAPPADGEKDDLPF